MAESKEFVGALKSLSAKSIVGVCKQFRFHAGEDGHRVWQESFKALLLWSGWMIWQKINYIHANPVKAGLVSSTKDYYWSSFRSFHSQGDEPIPVDHEWSWPEDAEKLSKAVKDAKSGGKPPFLTLRYSQICKLKEGASHPFLAVCS